MAEKAKVLVVANRTAESDELLEALRERAGRGAAAFTLLVPSTPHGVAWAGDMHSGAPEAEQHMASAVQRLRDAGLEVDGKIGDPDAFAAVQDAINLSGPFDEVIVSTLPTHLSKWLRVDLPRKAAHATGLPVTHVVGSEAD
jgi:nucleotide-binding universal stress UspA family protein